MNDVVIAGGGPTGLMLAAELALADVDVTVLERRTTPDLAGHRAGGFHARTLEVLDQRGVVDRFLEAGQTVQALGFGDTPLDLSGFPTRHPYTLGLWQNHIERLLREWVEELGVPIRLGAEVSGFAQDGDGVDVRLAQGESLRAAYLVGADGGRSLVRKSAGIDFVGAEPTKSYLIAEVEVAEEIPKGIHHDEAGIHAMGFLEDGRTVRMVVTERRIGPATDATMADLGAALRDAFGLDFGIHSPTWISRFTDATRQAADYRRGRVLLAGDAAHTHPPSGGQGIGLGVQDAVNLGWKLAQVVHGVADAGLLDSYHDERHPATARVLQRVMATALLQQADPRTLALRATFADLLTSDEPRTQLAGLLSGLDTAYDLGEGHPLLGRRMPDLDLDTADGRHRVYELLHAAQPVLIDLGGGLDLGGWAGPRVSHVAASYGGEWELPVLGTIPAPTGLLVRPDGHVAWVGEGSSDGLTDALGRWFGAEP